MGSALYQYLACVCGNYIICDIFCYGIFFCSLSANVYIIFCVEFLVNLCTMGYGISVGWMASAFNLFDSDDCPLPTGRVPMDEIAWAASILGIGGILGTIAVGWMAERVGRKNSLLAMAVPQIVSIVSVKRNFRTLNPISKCDEQFFAFLPFTDQLLVYRLCSKYLLFVCIPFLDWFCRRRRICRDPNNGCRNRWGQV